MLYNNKTYKLEKKEKIMPTETSHPLDAVEIRKGDPEKVRGLLRMLPENTVIGMSHFTKSYRGLKEKEYRIYAQAEEEYVLGDKESPGVSLIVVNPHRTTNIREGDSGVMLRVPNGATDIVYIPARVPKHMTDLLAGVQFNYEAEGKKASFFFGHEDNIISL